MYKLKGMKFNKLLVLERCGSNKQRMAMWLCKCDCGNYTKVSSTSLVKGFTKSCGCYQRQRASESNKTHGESHTKLFYIWQDLRKRCKNKSHHAYKYYGGRGIKVCKEWEESYINFKEWAINNGFKEGLTIDRVCNNLEYSPKNCRWVTMKVQNNNKRSNHYVYIFGEKLTLAQVSEKYNITPGKINYWLKKGKKIELIIKESISKEEWQAIYNLYGKEFDLWEGK